MKWVVGLLLVFDPIETFKEDRDRALIALIFGLSR